MRRAVDAEHADKAAHHAGDDHGDDDYLVRFQPREQREARIVAGQLHLVADRGLLHNVPGQHRHYNGGEYRRGQVRALHQLAEPEPVRQVCGTCDDVVVRVFPRPLRQELAYRSGNGIEHNGGDDLVDLELHLQHARYPRIEAADERRAERGHGDDDDGRKAGHPDADLRGEYRAEQQLPLAADVEDADAGADIAGEAAEAQHHRVLQCVADMPPVRERAGQHGGIGLQRVIARQQQDQRADDERGGKAYQQRREVAEIHALFHSAASSPRCPVM